MCTFLTDMLLHEDILVFSAGHTSLKVTTFSQESAVISIFNCALVTMKFWKCKMKLGNEKPVEVVILSVVMNYGLPEVIWRCY